MQKPKESSLEYFVSSRAAQKKTQVAAVTDTMEPTTQYINCTLKPLCTSSPFIKKVTPSETELGCLNNMP